MKTTKIILLVVLMLLFVGASGLLILQADSQDSVQTNAETYIYLNNTDSVSVSDLLESRTVFISKMDTVLTWLEQTITTRLQAEGKSPDEIESYLDSTYSRFLDVEPRIYGYNWSALQEVIAEEIERAK